MAKQAQVLNRIKRMATTGETVEAFLLEYIGSRFSKADGLLPILEYTIGDVGLRFRPFLLRLGYEAGNRPFDEVVPIAAGIELIQLSTLAIDDILDNSPTRNSKPSVQAKWGTGTAITLGNVLSSSGFNLIAEGGETTTEKQRNSLLRLFLNAHEDIYVGQFMDLVFEGRHDVTESEYLEMISKTTGSFIQASLVAGAVLWDASAEVLSVLGQVGMDLGIAYQLRDDVIDILGETRFTGKPEGGDIKQRKSRLPLIKALSENSSWRERLSDFLLNADSPQESDVDDVITWLKKTGAVDYTIAKTREFCRHAVDSLVNLPPQMISLAHDIEIISALIYTFEH